MTVRILKEERNNNMGIHLSYFSLYLSEPVEHSEDKINFMKIEGCNITFTPSYYHKVEKVIIDGIEMFKNYYKIVGLDGDPFDRYKFIPKNVIRKNATVTITN